MSFTVMRFLHKGWGKYPENSNRLLGYLLRIAIAGLHFSVIGWGITAPEYLVLAHCCIAVGLNSLDLYNFKEQHVIEVEEDNDDQSETKSDSSIGTMTRTKSNNSLDIMLRSFGNGSASPGGGDSSGLTLNIFRGREARAKSRKDAAIPTGPRGSSDGSPNAEDFSTKRIINSRSDPNFENSPSPSSLTRKTYNYDEEGNKNIQIYGNMTERPSSDSNFNHSNSKKPFGQVK